MTGELPTQRAIIVTQTMFPFDDVIMSFVGLPFSGVRTEGQRSRCTRGLQGTAWSPRHRLCRTQGSKTETDKTGPDKYIEFHM